MGFLKGLFGGGSSGGAATIEPVDHGLPDAAWFHASTATYDRTIGQHYGSPETMAAPGKAHYEHQDFGVALLFYGKAVDMLQTAYGYAEMQNRQPSAPDAWIVNGYVSAVGAALAMHPDAPVGESAKTTAGLLDSIASACGRVGLPGTLYGEAANQVRFEARAHLA